MNSFTIPPSPNWFNSSILACAPDNTLVYGSKNELIVIHPTPEDETPKIEILSDDDCNQKVVSVDVNPKWTSKNKQVLCSWEDKVVKILNMTLMQWKKCNFNFKGEKDNLVGARFLSEDRILSVTESGMIGICNYTPQPKYVHITNLFANKVNVTCFEPCPHLSHTVALGLKTGLIVVVDLRKSGTITHRFRGHTGEITTLSWCPAPVNIFPRKPGTSFLTSNKQCDIKNANKSETNQAENNETSIHDEGEELTSKQIDIPVKDCQVEEENSTIGDNKEKEGENKSDEAITAGQQKELPASPGFQESSWEIIETENEPCLLGMNTSVVSTTDEIVESMTEEPQKESSVTTNKGEILVNELQKLLEASNEKVVSVVEPVKVPSASMVEKIGGPVESMAEEPQSNLLASSEIMDNKVEQPQKEMTAPGEKVESMVEEPQKISDSHETVESTASCEKKVEENTFVKSVEMKDGTPVRDLLLASCGKDSSITVWRAKGDGRMLCMFRLPDRKISNKYKKNNSTWHTLKWVSTFYILASTNKGEILKFVIPKQINAKQEYTLVHNEHSNVVFAMAAHVPILTKENWSDEKEVKIWTFSHDMYLLNTTLDSRVSHKVSIETFCALVNCMTYSPVDPNRIALGLSNGTIKIWNMNSSSPKHFSTANYSPRIYGKITYLDWHPENDLCIAFSTEEGTIGLLNTNSKQKATWFKQYFSTSIHRIQWAPYEGKIRLYAIAKGTLVCFDPDNPKEDPVIVEVPEDTIPYYFSWKLDYSWMMLSTTCPKTIFFNSSLELKATYHHERKMSVMQWHPDSEGSESPKSFWVAVAIDTVLYILDFAEVSKKSGTLNIADVVKTKIEVHYSNIRSISWNPFNGDQLVSAGDDGLAFVLNALDGTTIASYSDRKFQPIKTIMWSPTEEDLLITTVTKSAILSGWKSTDHKGPLSAEVLKQCEDREKNTWKNVSFQQKKETDSEKKIVKSAKGVILPNVNAGTSDPAAEKVKILQEFLDKVEYDKSAEKPSNFLKLFESRDDVLELLNQSEKSHKDKGKIDSAVMVSIFKGDLQDNLMEAIQQSRVTPLMISVAPSVSISLWQKACETYANQLCGKPDADPLEVASHFLASQNIEKAIQHLCEKDLYKEALAMAKTRFPADSVILTDIISKWAFHSSSCGNLETAALCFIQLKKYQDAVKVLFRRSDAEILGFAYDLAKLTGNEEIVKAVKFRYDALSTYSTKEKSDQSVAEDGCVIEGNTENSVSEEKEMKIGDAEGDKEVIESENTEFTDEKDTDIKEKQTETRIEEKETKLDTNSLSLENTEFTDEKDADIKEKQTETRIEEKETKLDTNTLSVDATESEQNSIKNDEHNL